MKTLGKRLFALCVLAALCCLFAMPVLAASPTDSGSETAVGEMQTEEKQDATGEKAMAAAICVGLAAAAGAIGMGIAISKSSEGISRQPEAENKIKQVEQDLLPVNIQWDAHCTLLPYSTKIIRIATISA